MKRGLGDFSRPCVGWLSGGYLDNSPELISISRKKEKKKKGKKKKEANELLNFPRKSSQVRKKPSSVHLIMYMFRLYVQCNAER